MITAMTSGEKPAVDGVNGKVQVYGALPKQSPRQNLLRGQIVQQLYLVHIRYLSLFQLPLTKLNCFSKITLIFRLKHFIY